MQLLNISNVTGIRTQNPVRQSNGEWLSKLMITSHDKGKEQSIIITCSTENMQSLNAMVVPDIYEKEDK
jgi:hypothetical protein